MKSIEDLGVLIDGVTKTVKYETEKYKDVFFLALLQPLPASLVQSIISSAVKGIGGIGVRGAV